MKTSKKLISVTALMLSCGFVAANAATPLQITEDNPTISQNFNGAVDANLPAGWAIDVNRDATHTIRSWSVAEDKIVSENTKGCFVGPDLASNEKNGPYYFYDTSNPTDYAVGGITTGTGTANGADCINLMTAFTNNSQKTIDRLDISYAIEKYRYGNNEAGWEVSLYYSFDGEKWTHAGDNFKKLYPKDNTTGGASVVPISTDKVDNAVLMTDVAPGKTIYLAWMMSVASGTQGSGAQVFGIDDVVIKANFASDDVHYICIEDATRLSSLTISAPQHPDYYGTGVASTLTKNINGVNYKLWETKGTEVYTISVAAGKNTVGTAQINPAEDTYLCATATSLTPISDPYDYSGWIDPERPGFVASGIYIRGEMNSWGSPAEWEFSNEGNGTYALYDKVLSGAFKVADASWSSACNYGSNGSNVMVDEPYTLKSGTDTNISCGNNVFTCKRIVLTIQGGTATLLLEAEDSETGLTTVYIVGDFNSWNYMDSKGALKLDEADGLFKGRVSMTAVTDGLSKWLLYLRQGRCGAYGLSENATSASVEGTLIKGATGTIASAPATYDVTFSLTDGTYKLTEVESAPAMMTLNPAVTVLVPELPETVKVLSLNNSLIHYNDQARMFNEIAKAQGRDASWTKHTNLGKTLLYHWEEGEGLTPDGQPGAKMMVRSDAWSHIILQEQTALPRTNRESFRTSVMQWVEYIRENCPNPNAVVILPMNWHYAQDWSNFNENNAILMKNYADVAAEMGVMVCPVASAYQAKFDNDGGEVTEAEWFLPGDDRHPTIRATYMAALMEYGLIFNEDVTQISYYPTYTTEYDSKAINATIAADMRKYAADALKSYVGTVDHHAGTVRFDAAVYDDFGIAIKSNEPIIYTVDGGGVVDKDGIFTSDGTLGSFNVTATWADFTKKARIEVVKAETEVPVYPSVVINRDTPKVEENFNSLGLADEAVLPEGWRIDRQTTSPRTIGTFAVAAEKTMYAGGTNLPSNAKNGLWNFGADNSDDRAVGGITTGVADGTRAVNVYLHLLNNDKKPFGSLNIDYKVEKYRKGANAAGFAVQLYYSYDGRNWTTAGDDFRTYIKPDNATEGYAVVPGETYTVSANLPLAFGGGLDLYLAWNISVASGTDAQAAMALGIDDVVIEGIVPAVPEYKYHIYVDNQTTYDALGLYAYGESELFGAWPGQAPIDEQMIEGTLYQVFGHDSDAGSYNFIFNNWNQGKQLGDISAQGGSDLYFRITDNGATKIDNPAGVVDVVNDTALELYYDGENVTASCPAAISVYTLTGANVLTAQDRSLSLKALTPGLYLVTAKTAATTNTIKIRR